MENDGEGDEASRAADPAELDACAEETCVLMKTGPRAGDRAGGVAFLALMVVLAGAVHFYYTDSRTDSFANRLDAELLTHAEFALASNEDGNRLGVVPTWPFRLYASLRRDIALYGVALGAAAFLWGLSARARARRDAFVVHRDLTAELAELRDRLDRLEGRSGPNASGGDDETKG